MVVIDSVVAGVGTSTLAALLARELSERGLKCVLVDADLQGGGLDVLLGVENEDGSRFGEISAPLGNIDGKDIIPFEMVGFPYNDTFPDKFPYHAPVAAQ